MFAYPIRTAALTLCAAAGLAGCMGPYGYGGVSAGVGNGYYDPYYGSGYGYYGAGYPGYGYGISPYWGWNDGYYYPGTGYYVYDTHRRKHRLTDAQRRYWEARRERARNSGKQIVIRDNWGDFANHIDGGRRTQSNDGVRTQTERRIFRSSQSDASKARTERRTVRSERNSERQQRQSEARSEERGRSFGHRREQSSED